MKKVLFVLAASAFLAACNDSSTIETDTLKDSTMMTSDSTMMTPAPSTMDTTMMGDSSKKMSTDTMMKK